MDYALSVLVMMTIWSILAASLNLLAGFTGLYSLAHIAFMALGAYTVGLLGVELGVNFFFSLGAAILLAAVIGLTVGIVTLRFRGHQYLVATFALQVGAYSVALNWISLTHGPSGLPNIPRPSLFGLVINTPESYLGLSLVLALISVFLLWRAVYSPFGRVLKAIRESDDAALVCGKNVAGFRIVSFVLASAIAAVGGGLFAGWFTAIDPESFRIDTIIFLLAIVILGGLGNLKGSLAGVAMWFTLSEVLRFVPIPNRYTGPLEMIIFAILLIFVLIYRPEGLVPEHRRQ